MEELPANVLDDVNFDTGEGFRDDGLPDEDAKAGFKMATAADADTIKSLLEETNQAEAPVIPFPESDEVTLLAGLRQEDGTVLRRVVVRELNGEDEEALVRARTSDDPTRFIDTILLRGVVEVGGHPVSQGVLDQLTTGDRDLLLMGVRKATYGDQIEYGTLECPQCAQKYDLFVGLNEIPIETPEVEWQFTVPLRKGGRAFVRLPNGADQRLTLAEDGKTNAERNTTMLGQVVEALEDVGGNRQNVAGFPSLVRGLGIADRRKILDEVAKRMPGPRYTQGVEFTHDCGFTSQIPVTVMHLFPGL